MPRAKREKEIEWQRAPTFHLHPDDAKRFNKAVGYGDKATAFTNLFRLMADASDTDRTLWRTLINRPERLEIRRKAT